MLKGCIPIRGNKMRKTVLGIVLVSAAQISLSCAAQALPIIVTDVITGSSGNWIHNLSVTNNLTGTNDVYFFGVNLLLHEELARPTAWGDNGPTSTAASGGSGTIYPNTFFTSPLGVSWIAPGATLSGFKVGDHGPTAQTGLKFFASAYNGVYTGNEAYNNSTTNPLFEGLVTAGSAVPEPITWTMMITGFGLIGASMRRRRVSVAFA